jgi:hypothetical protein
MEVILFVITMDCARILYPYTAQPATPAKKITYIGREIETAGVGLILHTVKTCGTNADVVHIPAKSPRISIRFMFKPFINISFKCRQNLCCFPVVPKDFPPEILLERVASPFFALRVTHASQ